jgi:benzylsuccinate CoA-transferase BbsF subunit
MKKDAPLKGIKIANFAWVGVGPGSISFLSMWGATTVRVESHRRIDNMRRSAPYKDGIPGVNRALWFLIPNVSSYSISIDLKRPGGLDIAWRLIKWADVVAESFTPGTMKKLGIDYESVQKVKPDIVYVSTCQMGQIGPLANFAGFGFHASATAGITNIIGYPDRGPTPLAAAYVDPVSMRFTAIAVLAALEHRRRTGVGQYIDISQCETALQHIAPPIMDYLANGRSMSRMGNSLPNAAPHNVYPCQGEDRWCAIAVLNDADWEAFCKVINREWTKDVKFSSLLLRKQNEVELDALVSKWTKDRTAEEVQTVMQAAGVPCHIVSNIRDYYTDPQIKHRGYYKKLKHPVVGYTTYPQPPYKLSKSKSTWFPGPTLGQHNNLVFKKFLGMTDAEIAKALADGGITTDADLPPELR